MFPQRDPRPPEEPLLEDYARRLQRFRAGRRAIQLHLSQLRPYNRRQHHLRIAASILEPLISGREGALFRLANEDLVMICRGAGVSEIDDFVLRLRFLFSEDPLLQQDADGAGFCSWFDLETDYAKFMALVEAAQEAQCREAAEQAEAEAAYGLGQRPTQPIDPPKLGAIERAIAQADLSHLLKRQAICAVAATGQELEPVLYEIYISIDGLRDTLLPSHDFEANHWLFQDLTRYLDRRMIAMLTRSDDNSLRRAISLNLNIETLLSPEFLSLDAVLKTSTSGTTMVELQLLDVVADPAGFQFARDFLHDRGYRICLDGTSHLTLPLIDRERLGVDLIKLRWSSELADSAELRATAPLRDVVTRATPERVILCRCDTPSALRLGQELGIKLFQGYHLDGLLARPDPKRDAERLAAAAARHRRLTRLHGTV